LLSKAYLLFFTFPPFNGTIEDCMLFTHQPFPDFFDKFVVDELGSIGDAIMFT